MGSARRPCEQTMPFHIFIHHISIRGEIRRYTNNNKKNGKKFKILKYTLLGAGNVCVSIHHFRRLRAPQPSYVCPRTTRKDAENKSKQKSTDFQAIRLRPFLGEVFQRFNVQHLSNLTNIALNVCFEDPSASLTNVKNWFPAILSVSFLVAPLAFTFTYFFTFSGQSH